MKKIIIVVFLPIIALVASGCSKSYEEKPFFSGSEKLMVCKRPYSDNTNCYNVDVRNNGGETMTVLFENGSNVELEDMYCTKTIHDDDICQGADAEGSVWDVMPIGSNIE